MGTTLDALTGQSGVRLQTTAVIEGFSYVLTDGDPNVALAAYIDSGTTPFALDFTSAAGGLSVHWDFGEKVSPWKPMTAPGLLKFSVVPASHGDGSDLFPVSDIVGETVFKRVPSTETSITAAVDCNDTSITVARADDFAASGELFLGPETIAYSSRDTGTDVFTVSTRGKYPAVLTDTAARFARTHKPLTASEQDIGLPPRVTSSPTTWVGRWVSIWLHRNVGGTLDTVESDQSAAHLAFCGVIVGVEDVDGATVFECEDVRKKIYETRLNRDPFRAKLAEGTWVHAGTRFGIATVRGTTIGAGNDLVVVASGAAGSNQIDEGLYTAAELGDALATWLQGERAASRILFNVHYVPLWEDGGVTRGRFSLADPTSGGGTVRQAVLGASPPWDLMFLGWPDGQMETSDNDDRSDTLSPEIPMRYRLGGGSIHDITLTEPRGTWISQTSLLPVALRDPAQAYDGILKIGDIGYVRAHRTSDTDFTITQLGLGVFFGRDAENDIRQLALTVDEDASLDVRQVLLLDAPFKTLLLQILLSTGTAGFNSASYDTLAEPLGCGIPYSALGAGFMTDVENLSCADTSLTAIIDGPVAFHDLFKEDLILRRCFFTWGAGRLHMNTWATPTSTYATTTLTEAYKASPSGQADKNRAAVLETADHYNVVTIRFNLGSDGKYADELILKDASSIREHGERGIEIKARNTFRHAGAVGAPIDDLIFQFASFFGFTSRPWQVIRRTVDFNKFETLVPGQVVSVTDNYVRSPDTGKRYSNTLGTGGLQGYPGMVVGLEYDWGGAEFGRDGGAPTARAPSGQVDIMISPGRTIGPYSPCAQVDDTAATGGYVAGTKTLTCYAHEHSESSEVADATRFVAGYAVLVVEIDDAAASPTSWSDVVASQTGNTITLTTGLAGYDTTGATKYRVIFDAYASTVAAQKAHAFQADDADLMVVDTVQPYGFGSFGSSQSTTVTASTGQEPPARYATVAYGDGKALDVGFERDVVRLANNLVQYKTAFQSPTQHSEVRNFTGGGTRQLVECFPIFIGIGEFTAGLSRLLSMSPRIRSTTGATATCRLTLSRRRPTGSTRDDVTFVGPYVQASYSTTSTTFSIPSASTFDVAHIKRSDTLLGGVAWVSVEIITATEVTGLSRMKLGAMA